MSLTDFAAVVGALAWIPPIFVAIRGWMTKPQVRVITQPSPEIGFTTFGPILNLRVALTVTQKDIVITGVRLRVTHESGEQTYFSWRGIVQRMGTMNYPQVGAVPFEKEMNVLAMKVSQKDVEERFIRFQSLDFLERKAQLDGVAAKKLAHMRQAQSFVAEEFLRSQEMSDVYAHVRQSFSWKPGGYRLQVLLESPDAFGVVDDEYFFSLSSLDSQNISGNLQHVQQFFANDVLPQQFEGPAPQIPWVWVYPEMQKVMG